MVCKFDKYKTLWPEAVRCVVYVHNRILTRSTHKDVREKTPYEILIGEKPDLSGLRIFGTKVKVLKPKAYRKSKVESRIWDGVHVGYNPGDAYRAYIPELGRVFMSKDVRFIENLYRTKAIANTSNVDPMIDLDVVPDKPISKPESKDSQEKKVRFDISDDEKSNSDFEDSRERQDSDSENEKVTTRSGHTVNPPKRLEFSSLALLNDRSTYGKCKQRNTI